MATSSDIHKKAMIVALTKSLGIVSKAAAEVGISRETHYKWLKSDEDYKAAVDMVGEEALDFAESKLFELIDGPERDMMTEAGPVRMKDSPVPSAVIFYLKTRGKKRGYIERQEISGPDQGPIQIIVPDGL